MVVVVVVGEGDGAVNDQLPLHLQSTARAVARRVDSVTILSQKSEDMKRGGGLVVENVYSWHIHAARCQAVNRYNKFALS